jgi:hypothetical protein
MRIKEEVGSKVPFNHVIRIIEQGKYCKGKRKIKSMLMEIVARWRDCQFVAHWRYFKVLP